MTPDQLRAAFAVGSEQSNVEFKSAGLLSDAGLKAQVVRAVLGMANRRDGGFVVVGVQETPSGLDRKGMNADQLASWEPDRLADVIASYSDPNVRHSVSKPVLDDRTYLVIQVYEFADVPVVCKKGHGDDKKVVLRAGACYVRPRRKPETVEVSTYVDMRDLIDLAIEKGVRRFVEVARRADVDLGEGKYNDDRERFQDQREDFR